MSVADPGLDRLCCALAATGATVPVRLVSLDAPEALALSALESPQSIAAAGRATYWHTRDLLERRGVSVSSASALALRVARGLALELAGLDQRETARTLNVTPRTLRRDRELLRAVGRGALDGGELLPRVPRGAVKRGAGRAGSARAARRGGAAGGGQRRHPEGDAEGWRRCA